MPQPEKQFGIRSSMIAFVLVAFALLQLRQLRGIEARSGSINEGPWIQRIGAHESRDAIEQWLLANGFSAETRPAWSQELHHSTEKWFVDDPARPSMHVRLFASNDRLLATFCYRRYSWKFNRGDREDIYRQKAKEFLAWWRKYKLEKLDESDRVQVVHGKVVR